MPRSDGWGVHIGVTERYMGAGGVLAIVTFVI